MSLTGAVVDPGAGVVHWVPGPEQPGLLACLTLAPVMDSMTGPA